MKTLNSYVDMSFDSSKDTVGNIVNKKKNIILYLNEEGMSEKNPTTAVSSLYDSAIPHVGNNMISNFIWAYSNTKSSDL